MARRDAQEFITMARMKACPKAASCLRHAARHALLPLVTPSPSPSAS